MIRHRSGFTRALFLGSLAAALSCHAQAVHKCVKGGAFSYQSTPRDGASVPAPVTALTTAAAAAPGRAGAGGLPWEGMREGMSPEDVRRLVAGLEALVPNGKSESLMQRRGANVAGLEFVAQYGFDNLKGLKSVHLDRVGDGKGLLVESSSNASNLAGFEKLTKLLRSKYGPESNSRLKTKETGFPGLSASSEWSMDGAKVFVSVSPVTAETSTLHTGMVFGAGSKP